MAKLFPNELSGSQFNLIKPSDPPETNQTGLNTCWKENVKGDNQALVWENLWYILGL